MPSILFDESHGELLCSQDVHGGREMDTWARLRQHLEHLKFDVAPPYTDKNKPQLDTLQNRKYFGLQLNDYEANRVKL